MTDQFLSAAWRHDYVIEMDAELPGSGGQVIAFPPGEPSHDATGMLIRVRLKDGSWLGSFEPGTGKFRGIYATPSPTHMCVVAYGNAYWVNVFEPSLSHAMPVADTSQVLQLEDARLLVLVDCTDIVAYDKAGLRWRTRQVASDYVRVDGADGRNIWGVASDSSQQKLVDFSVDLRTGEVEGGYDAPVF